MWWLSLLFGSLIGLSLGLTGGGGAVFAVPLLVYGLNVAPRDAVGISLVSVGVTALAGFVSRWRAGQVEIRPGLLFAAAGMAGAPAGAWLAGQIPEPLLLLLFAGLMVLVAGRLWKQAGRPVPKVTDGCVNDDCDGPACRRDAAGRLILTSRCARLLLVLGILTGVLSGLFGVGGGFIIVPALVLYSGMALARAIGTSLMVITLISTASVVSQLQAGRSIPFDITGLFATGGVAGMFAGQALGRRLSGPVLQKVFAAVILAVAVFVVLKNLAGVS